MKRVLIANRGEIAVRILRACRELNLETVAVYSSADADSLHVKWADHAVEIGPGPAVKSYLCMERIIAAAKSTKADAIHPGYGFLSENSVFAEKVMASGLRFIGPSPSAMAIMGNKTEARRAMLKTGVPVIPGSPGPLSSLEEAETLGEKLGFPILIKAVSGGGGRGMRVIQKKSEFPSAFDSAAREAKAAFGDDRLYLEKYLENPRHVEIQILADQQGNTVYLGERECSVQRRHQKIIEETPSTALTESLRQKMGQAAVQAAMAVKYEGAGTVEFLLDQNGKFYFIEMNTRLQVEHPITEWCYAVDLVQEQLKIAAGNSLTFIQKDLVSTGAAIECRICAEDPEDHYRPCPGQVTAVRFPGGLGIRVDSHIYAGYEIPVYYDSLICKLIAWGKTREIARQRMLGALKEFQIQGVKTNTLLLQNILTHADFTSGKYDNHFLEKNWDTMGTELPSQKNKQPSLQDIAAMAVGISILQDKPKPRPRSNGSAESRALSPWKLSTWRQRPSGSRM